MMLTTARYFYTPKSTVGQMLVDDEHFCWTLEDARQPDGVKIDGETCIPAGVYTVIVDWSNRFQRMMPHILDVPNFDGIRIHSGNSPVDTSGCILVGYARSTDVVWDSKHAFNDLFAKISAALDTSDKVYINVMDDADHVHVKVEAQTI